MMEPKGEALRTIMEERTRTTREKHIFLYDSPSQWIGPIHGYYHILEGEQGSFKIRLTEVSFQVRNYHYFRPGSPTKYKFVYAMLQMVRYRLASSIASFADVIQQMLQSRLQTVDHVTSSTCASRIWFPCNWVSQLYRRTSLRRDIEVLLELMSHKVCFQSLLTKMYAWMMMKASVEINNFL